MLRTPPPLSCIPLLYAQFMFGSDSRQKIFKNSNLFEFAAHSKFQQTKRLEVEKAPVRGIRTPFLTVTSLPQILFRIPKDFSPLKRNGGDALSKDVILFVVQGWESPEPS